MKITRNKKDLIQYKKSNLKNFSVGNIIVEADGFVLHTNKINRIVIEDILWKSKICDFIKIKLNFVLLILTNHY